MTKNQSSPIVGDTKSPALAVTESGLRVGSDQASQISAEPSGKAGHSSSVGKSVASLKFAVAQNGDPSRCVRCFWLSFFFDGTGNNLNADLRLLKHSNIARLYRAHKATDEKNGILSVYIPGVGTYFPEIGDDGGSALGLGCGAMGEERLDFAIKQLDRFLQTPLKLANAPTNRIEEINIAVFGFSRGAALARAFINKMMEERCKLKNGKWLLGQGSWPVRFRFLGLFDTVASVGLPMSWNNIGAEEAYNGGAAGIIANRLKNFKKTRPERLAFSFDETMGVDPSPGSEHGHRGWGKRLVIHETLEEVRHFIAAHEIRNSFPVDSVCILSSERIKKPPHFHEVVYPGAHSDIGGGYASGEGGKSAIPSKILGLIPLHHMYDYALRNGVPMLGEWVGNTKTDFEIDSKLCEEFNHYVKSIGSFSTIGEGINKHMKLYYAWRFRCIRQKLKGDRVEAEKIRMQNLSYSRESASLKTRVDELERKEMLAQLNLNALSEVQEMQDNAQESSSIPSPITRLKLEEARVKYKVARQERLALKSKLDAVPDMKELEKNLNLYDNQLLYDAQIIYDRLFESSGRDLRKYLRPHYKALLEAYENEFEKNNGLKDEKIVSFFENYVHDSLAGFAKDATLPSDPRVVYLGGDEKYKYASLEVQNADIDNPKIIV